MFWLATWRRFRDRLRLYPKWDTLTAVTVILYSAGVAGAFAAIFTSTEWTSKFSNAFIITGIIVPFVSVSLAFGLQTLTQRYDALREVFRINERSRIMRILEETLSPQLTGVWAGARQTPRDELLVKIMYQKLISELETKLTKLRDNAIVEAYDNYWEFCASFYALARDYAECTSLIPIKDYQQDDMKKYTAMQAAELLRRGISVSRTFIFQSRIASVDEEKYFRSLCLAQAKDGFRLYFVILDELGIGSAEADELFQDFAVIDGDILQIGTYSQRTAQRVLYYEFHLLNRQRHDTYPPRVQQLFVPLLPGGKYTLKVQTHRMRISEYLWTDAQTTEQPVYQDAFREYERKNSGRVIDRNA